MARVRKSKKAIGKGERGKTSKAAAGSGEAKARSSNGEAKKSSKPQLSIPEVFSKLLHQLSLFGGFRDAELVRLRLQTESVEHGRGKSIVRNFGFRKFKEEPKAVTTPRGINGGSFEPTDRLLEAGRTDPALVHDERRGC